MATVENFIIKVKTEGAASIRVLADDMQDLALNSSPVGGALGGIAARLGPLGLAATAAASAFAGMGIKALQLAGNLKDIEGATGISADRVNSFAGSLIDAGGKAEDAGAILGKLRQSIEEAAGGNENLQKAFRNLGVFVTDASGKVRDADDILRDITDKFNQGSLSTQQYNAAIDIMGKLMNRLELQKLSSANNPAIKEGADNIDAFNDQIDKLNKSIKDNLIITFGNFAKAVNEGGISGGLAKITEEIGYLIVSILNAPTDAIAGFFNLFGAGIKNPVGLGDLTGLKGVVDQAKKQREQYQKEQEAIKKAKEDADKLLRSQQPPTGNQPSGPQGGGFGAVPEATLKAFEESRNRIRLSGIETDRLNQLRALDDIGNIEVNKRADIEKAIAEIKARERISDAQKQQEIIAKTAEIEAKAITDINNLRAASSRTLDDQVRAYSLSLADKEREIALSQEIIGLSVVGQQKRRETLAIEQQMLAAIERVRSVRNADPAETEAAIQRIKEQAEATKQAIEANIEFQNSFEAGWARAFNTYLDNASNAATQAEAMFNAMTNGMNSALDNFVDTGKFSFSDLANSIIRDIVKIQLRAAAANLFASGANFLGFSLPGRAIGGPVSAGSPYIIGERGPEMFIPAQAGNIIANNKLNSLNGGSGAVNISYNIQAVDAMSFKQMVARDPSFLYAVTEQGRKSIPSTRR
jgi:lambda family phage tail tape measure protein